MSPTCLTFVIPFAGLAVFIPTGLALRRVLRLPPWPTGRLPPPSLREIRQQDFEGTPVSELASHWNGWIAHLLPIALGCALLAAGLWFLADVGWFTMRLLHHGAGSPPRLPVFGGIRASLVALLSGAITSGLILFATAMVAMVGYYIGRAVIWPGVRDDITGDNFHQTLAYGGAQERPRTGRSSESTHAPSK